MVISLLGTRTLPRLSLSLIGQWRMVVAWHREEYPIGTEGRGGLFVERLRRRRGLRRFSSANGRNVRACRGTGGPTVVLLLQSPLPLSSFYFGLKLPRRISGSARSAKPFCRQIPAFSCCCGEGQGNKSEGTRDFGRQTSANSCRPTREDRGQTNLMAAYHHR